MALCILARTLARVLNYNVTIGAISDQRILQNWSCSIVGGKIVCSPSSAPCSFSKASLVDWHLPHERYELVFAAPLPKLNSSVMNAKLQTDCSRRADALLLLAL